MSDELNVEKVAVILDARGFWARDDGNGYTIARNDAGEPYLCTSPLMENHEPPWHDNTPDGAGVMYTWGEPSFGCLDTEVETYLHALEAKLIAIWRKLGEPEGAGLADDDEAQRAWEARRIACELCGGYGEPDEMTDGPNGGPAHKYCAHQRIHMEDAHNG